ncbi:TetR/AcrR family transcriptional regulator [Mycolicibacterium holsaticum]|uniref:HTH tetR-type domain-containing protein n=1 Tax=Mycolicibacterium holsaticum TaxID=152142 RepID=A0A1E3S2V4_9MYCO|nr:TetR/AcrR family transcriptional regulator [Mycolicibacterium holsaticum]MDA4108521.1 TetR family transcriptional regulator [Mycolicibacterium holsaticum DSM 44478 = JCM 12374]ODQ96449.1 hypothetical protein BHQ17_01075 [Mycolicibacterium holsaticum]QZA12734.1 TetR/AcrR family transcriptional regulator [Mycolicibacterium holsaticum DSM 44478 = JCM 12374]UNC09792.1 TetR/AcrR family transcriptional regulator [Mycolicibacterium holsaticum DSM 44478 = JCM 12374]
MTDTKAGGRPPSRKRLSAEQRREKILDAALEVFAESGFEGGRLREIATKAGITEPYLFRHFASKAELYEWAVIRPLVDLVEKFEMELEAIKTGPPVTVAALIRQLNVLMLQFMLDGVPYIGASFFSDSAGSDFYAKQMRPRVVEPLVNILRYVKGWPAPTVDVQLVAESIVGINYGLALDSLHTGFQVSVDKTSERVSRLYLLGIPAFHSQEPPRARKSAKTAR